jgi:hypothetical protein
MWNVQITNRVSHRVRRVTLQEFLGAHSTTAQAVLFTMATTVVATPSLWPTAKRFRLATFEDELERHQATLDQLVHHLKNEISKYIEVILEGSHQDEGSSIALTNGILEEDHRILDELAMELSRIKDQCLFNHTRQIRNDMGVCHRCNRSSSTSIVSTTTTGTGEHGGTSGEEQRLLQCKCFREGDLRPLYEEGQTSARGLRLCQSCTRHLQQQQEEDYHQPEDYHQEGGGVSTSQPPPQPQRLLPWMVCAVCNALDCTSNTPIGESSSILQCCDTGMIHVSPHTWCSNHFEDPSTAELLHLCLDCTANFTLLRPSTCVGFLCSRKVLKDTVPISTMQNRYHRATPTTTLSPNVVVLVSSTTDDNKNNNHINIHKDQFKSPSSSFSSAELQGLDNNLLCGILGYLDPRDIYRFGFTCFAHYKAAQAFSKFLYEQRINSFLISRAEYNDDDDDDDDDAAAAAAILGIAYSGLYKNWCHALWKLCQTVFRDFGFQFVNLDVCHGAAQYLYEHDVATTLLFTSTASTFEDDVIVDPVHGCQIGPPPPNDNLSSVGRRGRLAAICGNKSISSDNGVLSGQMYCMIGYLRTDGNPRMATIDVGLVASDTTAASLLVVAGSDGDTKDHWIAKAGLRLVSRRRWGTGDQATDAIFGVRYNTTNNILTLCVFSGDLDNFNTKDEWDESEYAVYDKMTLLKDNHPKGLMHWAVLLDGQFYPERLSLRHCTEEDYGYLIGVITHAVDNDACVNEI